MKLALQGERFVMIRAESEMAEQGRNEHDGKQDGKQDNDAQA